MNVGSNFLSVATLMLGLWLCLGLQANLANAQQSASMAESLKPLMEQAEKDGSTVIVISPKGDGGKAAEAVADQSPGAMFDRAMFRLRMVLKGSREFFTRVDATMNGQSTQGRGWLWRAILLGIAAIIIGRLAAKPVAIWSAKIVVPRLRPEPDTRGYKLGILFFRGTLFVVMALLAGVVASVVVSGYASSDPAMMTTAMYVVGFYIGYRVLRAFTFNLIMPSDAKYRPILMDDATAQKLYLSLQTALFLSLAIVAFCLWLDDLGLDDNTYKLSLLIGSALVGLLLSAVAVVFRKPVAQAILNGRSEGEAAWFRGLFARSWHVLVIGYMLAAWVVASLRILLDMPNGAVLVGKPVLYTVGSIIAYAVLLVIVDRVFGATWINGFGPVSEDPEPDAGDATNGETTALGDEISPHGEAVLEPGIVGEAAVAGETNAEDGMPAVSTGRDIDTSVPLSAFKPLAEHAAFLLVTASAMALVARLWGLGYGEEGEVLFRIVDILIVTFMSYIAYKAVNVWVAEKRRLEGDHDSAFPDEEMMGGGASRFLTLLPMFRNFLLITIVVIGGMIVLSEMGVDIGPLFAGAGVVGLAIGFGAQTLIRDVFSGAFFLIDDAFRKGEYIDIGEAKGTVEKISIRSFQLRHHRGALNTVPFGEIKQITNYSRDWVMMKLPLRVTYDTDLEMLRKLVKRLGIELLEDPDIGHKFLQPLKSQGALEMTDSAIIVRLKFMTKPGDQFGVRTKVLAKIRELFAEKGIKFAHREVTVRVATADEAAEMIDPAVAGAAAAAGASALQAEEEDRQQGSGGPR